jgi:hypothetical protein
LIDTSKCKKVGMGEEKRVAGSELRAYKTYVINKILRISVSEISPTG